MFVPCRRYGGVISALHEGTQCAACGQRFKRGDNTSDKYAQHLDWHFRYFIDTIPSNRTHGSRLKSQEYKVLNSSLFRRMKRRGREGLKKASSRKWYFEINDWVDFEEVEDLDDRAKSFFEQQVSLTRPESYIVEVPRIVQMECSCGIFSSRILNSTVHLKTVKRLRLCKKFRQSLFRRFQRTWNIR